MLKKLTQGIITALCASGLIALMLSNTPTELIKGDYEHTLYEDSTYKVGELTLKETLNLPLQKTASISGGADVYKEKEVFVSDFITAKTPFHALGLSWQANEPEGTEVEILVRTRKLNGQNSEWIDVHADIDDKDTAESEDSYAFIRTSWSTHLQYKVILHSNDTLITPEVSNISFTYIDSTNGEDEASTKEVIAPEQNKDEESFGDILLKKADLKVSGASARVISRNAWGANEDLRVFSSLGKPAQADVSDEFLEKYADEIQLREEIKRNEEGKLLTWPLQYPEKPVQAIFVHHTASTEDALEDSYATMRAIYYYHTVSRGWGDIGYNYLIDEEGRVFEGRYGGDDVVGAHTAGYNVGSVGVAIIGDYQQHELQSKSFSSLTNVLVDLSSKYGIDPTEIITMRGKNIYALSGHRDAKATTCPGEYIYEKLPAIRQLVKSELQNAGNIRNDVVVNAVNGIDFKDTVDRELIVLPPTEAVSYTFKLRNTGTKTWKKDTALIYKNGSNNIAGFPETVANLKESSVSPNATGTFTLTMQGGFKSGLKNYYLFLKSDGQTSERSLLVPVYIEPVKVTFSLNRMLSNPKITLDKGESTRAQISLKNTGNIPWVYGNTEIVSLSDKVAVSGEMTSRGVIEPGENATFNVTFKAGNTTGNHTAKLQIAVKDAKNQQALSRSTQEFTFRVKGATDNLPTSTTTNTTTQNTVSTPSYNITNKGAIIVGTSLTNVLKKESSSRQWIEVKNDSPETWERIGTNRVHLAFLKSPSIKISNTLIEKAKVYPGETVRVYFDIMPPNKEGQHFVNLILRVGSKRVTSKPLRFQFTVGGDGTPDPVSYRRAPERTTTRTETIIATPRAEESTPTIQTTSINDSYLNDKIRVKLSFEGSPAITSSSELRIYNSDGKRLTSGATLPAHTVVTVNYSSGTYKVQFNGKVVSSSSPVRIGAANEILQISNYENRPGWNNDLNDNEFRGVMEVRYIDASEGLRVINELPLEHYLYGIGEVSNGDPEEKVKTIVTLARTYAKFYMERRGQSDAKFKGKPYDLDDDPNVSQKYLGYGVEKRAPQVKAAIDATRGQVVTYNGEIVKTPYFNATDGTATKSALDVWGWTNTPYLVSVADPLCESTSFSGHGVGLSGCGATAAAERGYDFEEIIKYYYKGVELDSLYKN